MHPHSAGTTCDSCGILAAMVQSMSLISVVGCPAISCCTADCLWPNMAPRLLRAAVPVRAGSAREARGESAADKV